MSWGRHKIVSYLPSNFDIAPEAVVFEQTFSHLSSAWRCLTLNSKVLETLFALLCNYTSELLFIQRAFFLPDKIVKI